MGRAGRCESEATSVNLKRLPNHRHRLRVLAGMAPAERLRQALELSDFTRRLFKHGLRERFPNLTPDQLHRLYLERLARCHNRNY
jgi:hypothetical protein